MDKEPVYREDDHELLGFVSQTGSIWNAHLVFGYVFDRAETKAQAIKLVERNGLELLSGVWSYYDPEQNDWVPCILKEVNEHRVKIIRTSFLGYQDPDFPGVISLKDPDESVLKH